MASDGFYTGTPHQMIESGRIEKMFDVEGVSFDKQKMMFNIL